MITTFPQLGQWANFAELHEIQDKQRGQAMEWALRSPFYADRIGGDKRLAPDLDSFPLTSKQDLRDNYPYGMLAVNKEQLASYHESSGTAGTPTPSYYTEDDWVDLAERFARKWTGMYASDTFLVRTPYALLLTGHLAHAAGRLTGATVVPGDNRSLAMPYARVVRTLRDLGVSLTWSVPTECLLWAASAAEAGYRPDRDFPHLRALFVGGEPLTDTRKRRISDIWGVPVVEEYGSTETGSLGGECQAGSMHLWADRFLFEVYDPETGEFATEGTGQLVVTTLYRQAMPLVRYNLEDTVDLSYRACECGWPLPTVRVFGRTAFGYFVDGVRVTQSQLEDIVYSLPIEHRVMFWRARAEHDRLRVQIEATPGHQDEAGTQLADKVRAELGVDCDVETMPPGDLVPTETLTRMSDIVKPRSLFGPDEDWGKAVLYY